MDNIADILAEGDVLGSLQAQAADWLAQMAAVLAERDYDQICPEERAACLGQFSMVDGPRGLVRVGSMSVFDELAPCPIDAAGECPWAAERAALRFGKRLAAIGFGKRTFGAIWERVPGSVARSLRVYCNTIGKRLTAGEGIILSGPPGNGKTHCLALVGLTTTECMVRYITCADLFDRLHRDRAATDAEYRECGLLLLDDLGTQYNAEFGLTGFLALMDYRYREMKSTCIATNLSTDDVKQALGMGNAGNIERMLDRLRETNRWYPISEGSQREGIASDAWEAESE